ncbi:DUF6907 domain-containing protein [Streptomyces sp. NPDC087422]|uniref:DUF6907 domain-containing protein n=1 Tax=Streptomyces sp. NPDC087422 TaxID=3365786 RepID=UPI0038057AF9
MPAHSSAAPEAATPPPALPAPASSPAPRRWLRRIHGGGVITESCPSWCVATHAHDQGGMVGDLTHDSAAVAMRLPMRVQGGVDAVAWPVLSAMVRQWPYEDDGDSARAREPHVAFEPSPDETLELDADGLAVVIDQIRAHADRLEQVHAQLLAAVAEHEAEVSL